MYNNIKNKIKAIKNNLLIEETQVLFKDLYELKNKKIKIVIWFILLPITLIFLIENLIVFLVSYFFYFFIFLLKIKKSKNKKQIIKFKNRFNFLKNGILIFLKNILLEYPKCRSFFSFYLFGKNIKEYKKTNRTEKIKLIKYLLKVILNRYLIIIIFGFPYIVLYCNTWFTNKFYIIYNLKKKKNADYKQFLFTLLLNVNRDLMPLIKMNIKNIKIIIKNKKIIFNPGKDKISKEIFNLSKFYELEKNIKKIQKKSIIDFVENINKIQNKNNNIEKIWSKQHLETLIELNEEEVISTNETSTPYLYNKIDNIKIKNIFYGQCSYKSSITNCFITQPILSKYDYKNFLKNSINYKIKNIDLEKIHYNQILAILFKLEKGYVEAKFIENKNSIEFFYKENTSNLIDLIRKNKKFIEIETYEALENSNLFFNNIEDLKKELSLNDKIKMANNSIGFSLIKENNDIYQLLKH